MSTKLSNNMTVSYIVKAKVSKVFVFLIDTGILINVFINILWNIIRAFNFWFWTRFVRHQMSCIFWADEETR